MKPYIPDNLPFESLKWDAFISLIGDANAALARFDGILQGIVNPSVLLSPLTTHEAVLSSRIEGTEATLEEVLEYEAAPTKETRKIEDIREIINYRKAMNAAVEILKKRPISLNLMKDIHAILLDSVRGQNRGRGEFRTIQNWIGRPGCSIEEATFVPPDPVALINYLSDLEKYIHFEEKDRIIQLAIVHAQFEIIHPFLDGNGRVGRILIPLFLYEKGLLSNPMFYLSAYFEKNRDTYYDKLHSVSAYKDWEGWIAFFMTAVIEQARINSDKARAILGLYNEMKSEITKATRSQFSIQTLDTIFDRPIFRTTDFIQNSGIPKPTALRILNTLQKEKILITLREGSGRRAALLMFGRLLELVEK